MPAFEGFVGRNGILNIVIMCDHLKNKNQVFSLFKNLHREQVPFN